MSVIFVSLPTDMNELTYDVHRLILGTSHAVDSGVGTTAMAVHST